jgi:hypothetical protein
MALRGNLFGILLSALNSSAQFMVKSILAKFFTFFALFFIVHGFVDVLINHLLPASFTANNLNGLFGSFTSGLWYFLDLSAFSIGFPLIISAYVIRFIVRRIPVIG